MPVKEMPVVSVDVGTSKVSAVVVSRSGDSEPVVLGVGAAPARGVRKGLIVNLDDAIRSVSEALQSASSLAGVPISQVYVSIGGAHIRSQSSTAVRQLTAREVRQSDAVGVMEEAGEIVLSDDREVLHVLSQGYRLDDYEGVLNPVGLSGTELEGRAFVVTIASHTAQNIIKCLNRCGVSVRGLYAGPLASARAVITPEERELGVCVIDIGAGTTSIAVYAGGVPQFIGVVPVGATLISSDIATGLQVSLLDAERIKCEYGCAVADQVGEDETFSLPQGVGHSGRVVSRAVLAEIIEPRVQEIFSLVDQELSRAVFKSGLGAGVVITGGGALMPSIVVAAQRALGLPARLAAPVGVRGLADLVASPQASAVVGVAKEFALRDKNYQQYIRSTPTGAFGALSLKEPPSAFKAVANFFAKYL